MPGAVWAVTAIEAMTWAWTWKRTGIGTWTGRWAWDLDMEIDTDMDRERKCDGAGSRDAAGGVVRECRCLHRLY
jgi:hypothetical protein